MTNAPQHMRDLGAVDWLYRYKKKIIIGVLLLLTLTIALIMVSIAAVLRERLLDDSKAKTRELNQVIGLSFANLMLARNPDDIQQTLETIGSGESSVVKAFILNRKGRIAYSSEKREIGVVLDRFREESCAGCHTGPVAVPRETTMIIRVDGQDVLRNVEIIRNRKPCHACHPASDSINGKLIIDRSLRPTFALIAKVELMLAASGILCLIILVPFLWRMVSRGVDTYINEILLKSTELALFYRIVERLSKTIDMDELRRDIIEITREMLDADGIDIIFPKESKELGGIVWRKRDNQIDRRKFPEDDADLALILAWRSGELNDEKISEDGKEIAMPINKSGDRLALIIARKHAGRFDMISINLIKAMGSHIAVALENAALYQLAITDELTGLYSQRHFRNFMEKNFDLYEQYGEKLTLLMIDIDNFKMINDTYGHPAGDQILKAVAAAILGSTRGEDADFRYGGEEFAVVLPATAVAGGNIVAERIRSRIEGSFFKADGRELRLTVSIGVAAWPENAVTIRDVIVSADKALYEAKNAGKNRVVLSSNVPRSAGGGAGGGAG